MKPVVIIAIAVVCSVAAVLGVLVVLDQIATMQAQQAYDEYQLQQEELEKINRSMCVELYGNSMSMGGESNPYADCLEYGHEVMMKIERDECKDNEVLLMATNIERQCELRTDLQYLNAIKTVMEISNEDRQIIETEIAEMRNELKKLNQEWDEWEQRMDEYWESKEAEKEQQIMISTPQIPPEEILTLPIIKNDYSECKKNEQYGNGCYDKLKDNMDEYCRIATGNSFPEYDECFAEILKIQ